MFRNVELGVTKPEAGTRRLDGVDAARGLAIALMVLDHTLAAVDYVTAGPSLEWVRLIRQTVTRPSLPLFMLATGVILSMRRPSTRRFFTVLVAALAVAVLLDVAPNGVGSPEILLVWCMVMWAWRAIRRYPVAVACAGFVQVTVWPLYEWHGQPWRGYQPGMVAGLIAVGVLAGPASLAWADRLPVALRSIGRAPLRWYLGHLLVLSLLVSTIHH